MSQKGFEDSCEKKYLNPYSLEGWTPSLSSVSCGFDHIYRKNP